MWNKGALSRMNESQSIAKAKQIKEQTGGVIFSFPIEESNPFSPYAIVMCVEDQYFAYPDTTDISMAAAGILTLLEEMKKSGMDADYKRNVRLISYQTQMDARQLRGEIVSARKSHLYLVKEPIRGAV
jgi:hypothetical protein